MGSSERFWMTCEMNAVPIDAYSLSRREWLAFVRTYEPRDERAESLVKGVFHALYRDAVTDWFAAQALPQAFAQWLSERTRISCLRALQDHASADGTRKLLWRLSDGKTIESVIISRKVGDTWRYTACISSQVGCAMACSFCLTGKQGFERNLTLAEIVAQVAELRRLAPIQNIVFMGMGEPLHNYDAVTAACRVFLDRDGFCFSRRRITVSTSGLVPQIRKLGQDLGVALAISLNGSSDANREAVMPVNRKWGIDVLLKACREYPVTASRPIMFEYVLLSGVNDSVEDADRVFRLLQEKVGLERCKVNLLPYNDPGGTPFKRPSTESVKRFQHALVSRGLSATIRQSRGRDILAACGQLKSADALSEP